MANGDQATGTVDFLNDPDFQGLPAQEKHQVMLSLDPDYKALPPGEQAKALNTIHYGPNGTKFEQERPGTGVNTQGAGKAAWESIKKIPSSIGSTLDPTQGLSGAGLTYAGVNPRKGTVSERLNEIPAVQAYHEFSSAHKDPHAYKGEAPVAALGSFIGASDESARRHAERGEGGAILGEAAVPAALAVGSEAFHQVAMPKIKAGLESRRLRLGPENIEAGLDTPGGKRGQRAADMQRDIHVATGDLAEIGRETPGKVTRMLTRTSNAEALHDLAEKIDARQEDMWEKGHEPGIQRHAQAPVDQNRIVAAGQRELTAAATQANATEAAAASKWLDEQNVPMTLEHADNLIREINEDLKGKGAETRYGPLQVRTRQAVVKALRAEVDRVLGDAGEAGVKAVNRRWGALENIKNRLRENAVSAARKENKEGFLPQWAHTYAFLHPDMGLSIGVGINTAKALAPSLPGQTLRGVRQLGKTSLTAPYEAVPPSGWGTPPAGLLPAPSPQLPLPGAAEVNHPTGPASPAGPIPPQPGPGVQAPRQVYRAPETGQMQRGYLGVNPPIEMGRTAEGGPMYEPVTPPFETPRPPADQRKAMLPYAGTERRSAAAVSGADPMRMARIQVLRDVIADPMATSRDKVIARQQLDDMLANPFERTNPAEVDVNKAKQKNEKTKTKEEATAASEKRKEGQNKRFEEKRKVSRNKKLKDLTPGEEFVRKFPKEKK